MTEQNAAEATETEGGVSDAIPDEQPGLAADASAEGPDLKSEQDSGSDSFPREVVEELRRENGKYRKRAQQADDLAKRLHVELVRATGRLADPTDLPFDAEHLADASKMGAAIDGLLESKPHLASRRPTGDIGQGNRGPSAQGFSLLDKLKELT